MAAPSVRQPHLAVQATADDVGVLRPHFADAVVHGLRGAANAIRQQDLSGRAERDGRRQPRQALPIPDELRVAAGAVRQLDLPGWALLWRIATAVPPPLAGAALAVMPLPARAAVAVRHPNRVGRAVAPAVTIDLTLAAVSVRHPDRVGRAALVAPPLPHEATLAAL